MSRTMEEMIDCKKNNRVRIKKDLSDNRYFIREGTVFERKDFKDGFVLISEDERYKINCLPYLNDAFESPKELDSDFWEKI